MGERLASLPLDQIDDPPVLLREVTRLAVAYIELKDSIEKHGFLNSISVRPIGDRYQVVDGMYRVSAARDLRLVEVPAIIKTNVSDEELLLCQVAANACRQETTPIEFAKQIRRVMKLHPSITIGDLSVRLSKSSTWIKNQLNLLRLKPHIQVLVDRGEICLGNAYLLAKLPRPADYIAQATSLTTPEFKRLQSQIVKQFTERVRQGKLDNTFRDDFEAQPYLRSARVIKNEYEYRTEGPRVIVQEGCKTHLDGFYAALKWVQTLDVSGVNHQKKNYLKKFRNADE
jgi:ParB/RepB/Spo0J family partition protein